MTEINHLNDYWIEATDSRGNKALISLKKVTSLRSTTEKLIGYCIEIRCGGDKYFACYGDADYRDRDTEYALLKKRLLDLT